MVSSLELEARLDNLLANAQKETADTDLFAPIPEREECPLCLIPVSVKERDSVLKLCCGKTICIGCGYKHMLTDMMNKKGVSHSWDDYKCPFCQQEDGKINNIKCLKRLMKKKNPEAFMMMAVNYETGEGVFQSETKSLEMRICAAELGHAPAYDAIAQYYHYEIVKEDISRALEFYEIAAKKGNVKGHFHLADFHGRNENNYMRIKHLKVAASAGDKEAMDELMRLYKEEFVTKEDLTQTLRAYQTSNDLVKSKDRDDIHDLMDRYGDEL